MVFAAGRRVGISEEEGNVQQKRTGQKTRAQGRRWEPLAAVFALAALGWMAGCSTEKAANRQAAGPPPAMPVKIQTVQLQPVQDISEYVATLKSRSSAAINPQVEGQVTQIYVRSGDRVAAGTPLMQIDPLKQESVVHSQENTRAAAMANLGYAKRQFERAKQLYDSGVVSKQVFDSAQTAYDAARAQVDALDAQLREQQVELHYYRVVAPTAGIVGDVPVRLGDRVTTTTLLTTVDQPGNLEAYIQVPIERASALRLKLPVQIVDSQEHLLATTRIDFISPEVNQQLQSVLVKAQVPNPRGHLRTDQFVRARIVWSTKPGLLVPVLAIARISGQDFAFVAEGSGESLVARQRQVQVGRTIGNDYVVTKGIQPGDRVIVSGTQMLIDGARIAPQK
jgi:RND family efflux transporter MFP subunit